MKHRKSAKPGKSPRRDSREAPRDPAKAQNTNSPFRGKSASGKFAKPPQRDFRDTPREHSPEDSSRPQFRGKPAPGKFAKPPQRDFRGAPRDQSPEDSSRPPFRGKPSSGKFAKPPQRDFRGAPRDQSPEESSRPPFRGKPASGKFSKPPQRDFRGTPREHSPEDSSRPQFRGKPSSGKFSKPPQRDFRGAPREQSPEDSSRPPFRGKPASGKFSKPPQRDFRGAPREHSTEDSSRPPFRGKPASGKFAKPQQRNFHDASREHSTKDSPRPQFRAKPAPGKSAVPKPAADEKASNRVLKTLDRILSKAGICSRTEAVEWITRGRMKVNGKTIRDPEHWVDVDRDKIILDGKPLRPQSKIYILLYKPKGYLTTYKDPDGRPTVYDLVQDIDQWAFPVGRLDQDTSGLLILTNDTDFAEHLTNPDFHVPKTYLVKASTLLSDQQLQQLAEGLDLKDGPTRPAKVRRARDSGSRTFFEITITEGRNRQVRRMVEALDSKVLKLVRIAIGSIRIHDLTIGRWRMLGTDEVRTLRKSGAPPARVARPAPETGQQPDPQPDPQSDQQPDQQPE